MAGLLSVNEIVAGFSSDLGVSIAIAIVILAFLVIWTIIWKGIALWKSARKGQPVWFIVLLIVNTFGILEILYIFLFSKIKLSGSKRSRKRRR